MACGMIAMQLAGVEVESYDAYEIDKYAIKTAQHNFPMIKEHGDVFGADFTQYEGVDFGIGGSPCTHWSIAQTKNRETTVNRDSKGNVLLHQSGIGVELFSQFSRMLSEAKPKFFIYENNKSMSKEIRTAITECFGFEPTEINSALVSAQNRQRLYWVGKRNEDGTYSKVNVEQPADRGILLKDVLDNGVAMREKAHAVIASAGRTTEREFFVKNQGNMAAEPVRGMENDTKSRTLTANYWKTNVRDAFVDCAGGRTMAAEPVCVAERGRMYCGQPQHYEARTDGKTNTLTSVEKDNRVAEPIPLSEREMDYMVRDHQERRWNFCNRPGEKDKSECITANIHKGVPYNVVAEPINDICQVGAMPRPDGEVSTSAGFRIYSTEAKGRYLCANGGGAGAKTGL